MLAMMEKPRLSVDRSAPFLWYTLSVIPQSQARVCQRARELGFETYVPISRTPPTVRKFGRQRVTEAQVRPLMPGYVFTALPSDKPRFDLFQGDGVSAGGIRGALGFVGSSEGPMAVSEAIIDDMRLRERNGEFDLTGLTDDGRFTVPKWVKRGAFVRLLSGPFAMFNGVIERIKGQKLVTVGVEIFGRVSPIDVPMDWIEWIGRGAY